MKDDLLNVYEIHHKKWELNKINLTKLNIHYQFRNLKLEGYKHFASHYSKSIKIVNWSPTVVEEQ